MIIIRNGQFIVPECERKIGFTGDNAHKTVKFLISDSTQGEWLYRIYLRFDDGTVNYFIPDSTKTDDGTEIIWEVKDEHIFKSGIVMLQIKAFNNTGEVYHTSVTHLIVGDTIEFGDCFSVKQNTEFLEYEKRLNEILKQIVTEQSKLPYIGSNKHWFVYDRTVGEFVDTNVNAEGACEFEDGSITTDKLANGSVTGYRLYGSDNANSKIARETITGGNIGNIAKNTITDYNLADGAVTMPKIAEEVFEELNGRYTNIEVIDNIARVEYLNSCTDKGKIYLINSITPPFATELSVSTGSTYGYLHWVNEMQKLTVIDGASNAVKTFSRSCQRGEGSQASVIVGWSNFAEAINSNKAITTDRLADGSVTTEKLSDDVKGKIDSNNVVNLGEVNALSTLNGCTDTQKTYFFKVSDSLASQITSWSISGGYAVLNYYKLDDQYGRQVLRIIRNVEFTFCREYIFEDNYWYSFSMINTANGYLLENRVDTLDRFFTSLDSAVDRNTADIAQLKSDVLDNTEAITQNTADIDELKVKALPSVNLAIPSEVVAIPDLAFCANQSIISVTVKTGVKTIGTAAFYKCANIRNVTIENGVSSIGARAFSGCTSLETITLPDTIKAIPKIAFAFCSSLTSVTIPDSVTEINTSAFQECESLKSVTLGISVATIANAAFYNCINLSDLNIPSSVTSVTLGSFGSCYQLTNVTIGDGFNANNLNLSASTQYTVDTIVSWLNALADRTGQTAYTLTIGATNKAKLTAEQLAIATNKNWNIA